MTTTRKELVNSVSEKLDLNKNLTSPVIDTLFEVMRQNLIEGNRIEIRGFGALEIKKSTG